MQVPEEGLILNIDKPKGITSFGVVSRIRKKLGIKKVGHCGTLDPIAEGVLIVLVGKATKRAEEFSGLDKKYRAVVRLGISTDTYDNTGKVVKEHETANIDIQDVKRIIQQFSGEIEQIPPMFSAVKIGGKKLYKLARQGVEIERHPRKINIFSIELVDFQNPLLVIDVHCSKGTYIRSLADDIGKALGCGGCIESLTRLSAGDFSIENSIKLDEFLRADENIRA